MYTLTQLIRLSKTLLEEENMQSDMSNVKEALFFFKNLSLDSKNECARPVAITEADICKCKNGCTCKVQSLNLKTLILANMLEYTKIF